MGGSRRATLFLCALVGVALSGCRSTKETLRDYESSLVAGKFAPAAAEMSRLADEGGRDELCWQLNAAAAQRLAGDNDEAIRRFDIAEDLFSDEDGRGSVAKAGTAAYSMMTGDYAVPYPATGQDRVFACLYKAIDFGLLGRPAAVRTELNRAMLHQSNWLSERSAEMAAADERMRRDASDASKAGDADLSRYGMATNRVFADASFSAKLGAGAGFDPQRSGRLDLLSESDYVNAYLLNVNEIFRRNVGDSGPKPKDRVTVFVEDGLCPCRDEWRLDLPMFLVPGLGRYAQYVGMALPKLRYRNAAVTGYSVTAAGQALPLTEIQDVDRLVRTEFDVAFRGALCREIARAVVKVGAQAVLGAAAKQSRGGDAELLFLALQAGVSVYSYCTTEADVRSWTALPKKVYMIDLPRPADGVVQVNCGLETVRLNAPSGNTMAFVRKTSSAAPSVVKLFTLPN